jgi:predicted DNA-binding transcriptional regulator AlpA
MSENTCIHTILRLPQVKQRTGLSRSTIYSRIKTGTFPAPISLGVGQSGFSAMKLMRGSNPVFKRPVNSHEAAMNENIAATTTWHHRRKVRAAFRRHITTTIDQYHPEANWCDITLTLRQGVLRDGIFEKLTRDKVSKCIEDLMKAVNRRVYKNAYRRYGKRLVCVPVIEKSVNDRLHIHMLLEIPAHMQQDFHKFFDIIRTEWRKSRWCYKQTVMRRLPRDENVHGWAKYILKDVSENDEVLDVMNLYLGRFVH